MKEQYEYFKSHDDKSKAKKNYENKSGKKVLAEETLKRVVALEGRVDRLTDLVQRALDLYGRAESECTELRKQNAALEEKYGVKRTATTTYVIVPCYTGMYGCDLLLLVGITCSMDLEAMKDYTDVRATVEQVYSVGSHAVSDVSLNIIWDNIEKDVIEQAVKGEKFIGYTSFDFAREAADRIYSAHNLIAARDEEGCIFFNVTVENGIIVPRLVDVDKFTEIICGDCDRHDTCDIFKSDGDKTCMS
ncbi:MAG: hypothetical protein K2F99_08445, partial [Muribaculaceae bacterium]|nr:hypothetical protein [Muribaculaceae bacterium]